MTNEQKKGLLRRFKLLIAIYSQNKAMMDELQLCLFHLMKGNMETFKAIEFYENGIIELIDSKGVKLEDIVFKDDLMLEEAIKNENYELAAILRDKINNG
jgi:hypothetical protein